MVPLVCCCHLIKLMFFPGFSLMVKPSLHSPCLSFLRCLQYSKILWAHHQVNIVTSVSFANHVKLTMQRENQRIIFLGSVYLNLYLKISLIWKANIENGTFKCIFIFKSLHNYSLIHKEIFRARKEMISKEPNISRFVNVFVVTYCKEQTITFKTDKEK